MDKHTRIQIMELIWPVFAVIGLVGKAAYKISIGWWLDSWLQRKANRVLWEDVQTDFHFLCPKGFLVKQRRTEILPFDYASVCVRYENLLFFFTRGRGELNVSLSSPSSPLETYRLAAVIAALDSTDVTEQHPPRSQAELANLLRPRLAALNEAFSDGQFPEFKKKLADEKRILRAATKQAEWELNKKIRELHT